MSSTSSERARQISETITHCGIALALIVGGVDGMEKANGVSAANAFFVLAGATVLATTLLRQRLERWMGNYDALAQVLDGMGVLVGAWLAHSRGSVRLPPILLVVGLLSISVGIIRWKTPKGRERSMLPQLERLLLVACLAGITWILGCNVAGYGDFWMNVTALPLFGLLLLGLAVWHLKLRAVMLAKDPDEARAGREEHANPAGEAT